MLYLQIASFRAMPFLVRLNGIMSIRLLAVGRDLHGTKGDRNVQTGNAGEALPHILIIKSTMGETLMPVIIRSEPS